jgi:DNA-directed RNA polymerase subunit H (RpoH/RPB5)
MRLADWSCPIRILGEMCHARGYTNMTLVRSGDDPHHLASCTTPDGSMVHLYITEQAKVGVRLLRLLRENGQSGGARLIILVCPGEITPSALKEIDKDTPRIQVFTRAEVSYNPLRHRLVPQYHILSSTERQDFLASLSLPASALPRLLVTDRFARFLGLEPGTIVHFIRRYSQMEPQIYYRIVH